MLPKSSLELKWKEHNVDLAAFDSWVKSAVPSCCGSSADYRLTLWFLEDLPEETKAAVEAKWAELDDPEHEMVKSYCSALQRQQEQKDHKLALLNKSWDELTVEERKLIMGL